MRSLFSISVLSLSTLILAANQSYGVVEVDVTSVIAPTVGDAFGGFVPATVGDRARFNLNLFDTTTSTSRTATLQVTLVSKEAGLINHSISTGQNGNTDRVGIAIFGNQTNRLGTYEFRFFNTSAFTTPLPISNFVMQVSDIDASETVNVSSVRFPTTQFASPTDLIQSPLPGDRTVVTNAVGENISKLNPIASVNFTSIPNVSTFLVTLGGTSNSGREFQFDFTPDIALVPESSAYASIFGIITLGIVLLRRRRS